MFIWMLPERMRARRVLLGTVMMFATIISMTISSVGAATAQPQAEPVSRSDAIGPLKISTIVRPPFVIRTDDGFTGFSIDLWRAIAEELDLDFELVEVSMFSEMFERVEQGEADAAIANISITASRERVLDFTQPIFDSGLQIMVRNESGGAGLWAAIVNWEMFAWVAFAFFLLFVAANLIWFFERRAQPYFEYPYREGLWRSFWWALITIVNGGFEERIPRTPGGRVFSVMLVVASLFIVSAFVAKITTTLTVGELRAQIQGFTDLYGRKVGTTMGSTSASFLKSQSIRFKEFADTGSLFVALENGTVDAVVHDAPILAYYASTRGRGHVRTTGAVFRPEKYGIALPARSAMIEPINLTLLRLREDGTYAALMTKWFGNSSD